MITTFLYFYFYPTSTENASPFFLAFILVFPILTLLNCLIFAMGEKTGIFIFAKTAGALYAAGVFISAATFQDYASPASLIAGMVLGVMEIILIIMMITLGVKNYRHRKKPSGLSSSWLFRDIFFSIIGGWMLGILFWSMTTPAIIIAAAEKAAAGATYCIRAHNGPARSLFDLTALRFYSFSYRWRDMGDCVPHRNFAKSLPVFLNFMSK